MVCEMFYSIHYRRHKDAKCQWILTHLPYFLYLDVYSL